MKAVFLRLIEANDKEAALLRMLRGSENQDARRYFRIDPSRFSTVPRSPFAYWVSDRLRGLFSDLQRFESEGRAARQGGVNGDDFRWIRLWTEVRASASEGMIHVPIVKGGSFSRFFSDVPAVAQWDGRRGTFWAFTGLPHRPSLSPASFEYYFRPGLTWPLRGSRFSAQAVPAGCIFSVAGKMAFGHEPSLLPLLALFNCEPFDGFIAFFAGKVGGVQYEAGLLQQVPVPSLSPEDCLILGALSRHAWSLKWSLDTRRESSHAFSLPAVLQSLASTLVARAAAWADRVRRADTELTAIQAEIDDRCFDLYGINDEDRKAITEGFGGTTVAPPTDDAEGDAASAPVSSSASDPTTSARPSDDVADPDDSDELDESTPADATALTADLLSWAIGVAFGRFDLRLATGERALPPEPDPFDPLPVCSPGMLTGADGLPCATPAPGYPIDVPQDGVLLDDPGHPRDLTSSARAVFDVVFVGDADARWQEAAGILDPKNHDLRAFAARAFFEQHLKSYSKSRRKAPIYWQLATPSASYSVWLYAHRLTADTFFHVLHDVVAPKLGLEERKLLSLTQESGPNPTASQRKEIAAQETFVDELRAFSDEVTRVAPLWKPDLDDGVVLTMAPLWRLVPQHRAWQKELKAAWDSLSAGEYDWAHVAMHFWPERVVPKCATDRSLAIAHGLEEMFWEECSKGKWAARCEPLRPTNELIRERTSPAVKAAISGMMDTAGPSLAIGPTRKRRAR